MRHLLSTLLLTVPLLGQAAPKGTELASFDFGIHQFCRDASRPRMYATVPTLNSVAVFDTQDMRLVATVFTGSNPEGCVMSSDGNVLFVANTGSTVDGIARLDLNTLTRLPSFATAGGTEDVVVDGNNRLFALSERNGILILNETTGADLGIVPGTSFIGEGHLAIALNGNALIYGSEGSNPSSIERYDISQNPIIKTQSINRSSRSEKMLMSDDGQFLLHCAGSLGKLSPADFNVVHGTIEHFAWSACFSPSGGKIYFQNASNRIEMYNATTYLSEGQIDTPGFNFNEDLLTDSTGTVLFAGRVDQVKVYATGDTDGSGPGPGTGLQLLVHPAVELRFQTELGKNYQVQWASPEDMNTWHDFGAVMAGTGAFKTCYDNTRDANKRVYRVEILP